MTDEQQPRSSRGPADPPAQAEPAARETSAPRTSDRGGSREPAPPRGQADELPWIDDPVSRAWVLFLVLVFAAIVAYGVLFGRAGMLTTQPSPAPTPVVTSSPEQTPTPVVTSSPEQTASPALSPTLPPSPTPAGSPTPAVSPSPAASPSPTGPATSPSPAAATPSPT